jgi:hypothetical protein
MATAPRGKFMAFTHRPKACDMIDLGAGFGQRFLVTVDVEEEFDWEQPIRREGYTLETVTAIADFQELCDQYNVNPLYLIDFPVIDHPVAGPLYADLVRQGRAEVGIQLHPWVNPPFDEEVTQYNSFAGNLPLELEQAKLIRLRDRITEVIGTAPISYRAGRYGLGENSIAVLSEAGLSIDTSVRASFDYSDEGGPDYSQLPLTPYWLDRGKGLAEIPVTTVFWGLLRQQGQALYPRLEKLPTLQSILSRTGMLERIALTPEDISFKEVMRGIDIAIDDGLPILNFSFHSPSLRAGYTPYVNNLDQQEAFFDWWRRVFDYLAQRKIPAVRLSQIDAAIKASR